MSEVVPSGSGPDQTPNNAVVDVVEILDPTHGAEFFEVIEMTADDGAGADQIEIIEAIVEPVSDGDASHLVADADGASAAMSGLDNTYAATGDLDGSTATIGTVDGYGGSEADPTGQDQVSIPGTDTAGSADHGA